MEEKEILERAKFIYTSIRMVRDRFFRQHHAALFSGGKAAMFGDLSMSQFHTLMIIRERERVSLKELAGMQHVAPSSASAMVNKLVEKGLLERHQSVQDRRKIDISLSRAAKKHHEEMETAIFASFSELIRKIGPDTTGKWCQVLGKIRNVIESEDAQEFEHEHSHR